MITDKDMRDFAELLVSWCMRDLEAGLVRIKPPVEPSGGLTFRLDGRSSRDGKK